MTHSTPLFVRKSVFLCNNKNGDSFEILIYIFFTTDLKTAYVKAQETWLVSQRFLKCVLVMSISLWALVFCVLFSFMFFRAGPGQLEAVSLPPAREQGRLGTAPAQGIGHLCGDRDGSRPGWDNGPCVGVRIRWSRLAGVMCLYCFLPALSLSKIGIFRIFWSEILPWPWT